ncbi:MAG: glutamine synthetase family protein [Cyanobacteria bacterium P01_H01_bin.119]
MAGSKAPVPLEFLHANQIRFVRVGWCDNANVIRAKAIHIGALERALQSLTAAPTGDIGIALSTAQQAVPVTVDAPVSGGKLGPVGEVALVPDWSTLALLPYAPGQARVLGTMYQGSPWPWCPRYFLQRMISAAAEAGITVQAAFESEFYLVYPPPSGTYAVSFTPADSTLFAATAAMDQHFEVINQIADALVAQGVAVEQYYPESGPGQQEISVRYGPAMQAADQQIVFRETVCAIARQHGLIASFVPKLFEQSAGSGCHLHLSLWQGDRNVMSNGQAKQGELSDLAAAFVAGLLRHLPGLMAVTTPIPNSYRRLQPHCWSGAFRAWGYNNREAAVRVPLPASGSPSQIELKTVDNAANPYLALGCAIAAGLDGIHHQLPLASPVQVDPGTLSDSERHQRGITRLPITLHEAIAHLRQDIVLLNALGDPLAQTFLAVRQAEWEAMHELTLADELKLLLERY